MGYLFFSTEGRIPRSRWWIGLLVLVVISIAALGIAYGWLRNDLIFTERGRTIILAISLALLWPSYCLSVKRLHDRDRSAILAVIVFALSISKTLLDYLGLTGNPLAAPTMLDAALQGVLALAGLFFLVDLGMIRGTQGPNRYGPDPLARFRTA